jgi:hypothetical protein
MSPTGLNWTEEHPRSLADLTGDGYPDVVGFGDAVWQSRRPSARRSARVVSSPKE